MICVHIAKRDQKPFIVGFYIMEEACRYHPISINVVMHMLAPGDKLSTYSIQRPNTLKACDIYPNPINTVMHILSTW